MKEINQSLGNKLCCDLSWYDAFTGCNFIASFSRKGKVNPQKKVRKNAMAIKVVCELWEKEIVNKKQIRDIEKFVCEVHGKKQLDSVNDAVLKYSWRNVSQIPEVMWFFMIRKWTVARCHCAPASSKIKSNEQITSAVYGTMLQQQTLQIFNLKTAAGSSKIACSKSNGWKEKCFQEQLRLFAQKMNMTSQV